MLLIGRVCGESIEKRLPNRLEPTSPIHTPAQVLSLPCFRSRSSLAKPGQPVGERPPDRVGCLLL
jgi:hypothetical protein